MVIIFRVDHSLTEAKTAPDQIAVGGSNPLFDLRDDRMVQYPGPEPQFHDDV